MLRKAVILIILVPVFSFFSGSIDKSWAQDEEVVDVKIFRSYDRIHPGMDLMIALRVDILAAWHINSNVPTESFMEATKLYIPSESAFSFSEVKYPEAFSAYLEFSKRPLSVFEGEITIVGVIPIPEDIALGKHPILLQFNYQACDDMTCLAPEIYEEEITITVVDRETTINKINREIFKKFDRDHPFL